jgi:hypothetical protein
VLSGDVWVLLDVYLEGRLEVSTAIESYQEGDRCTVCRYWWWDDNCWHSLVPILYHDTPELAVPVVCPRCAGGTKEDA